MFWRRVALFWVGIVVCAIASLAWCRLQTVCTELMLLCVSPEIQEAAATLAVGMAGPALLLLLCLALTVAARLEQPRPVPV